MSSPAPSDVAAPATEQSGKKITFRFCRECANLLYPLEDKQANQLMFYCRACSYQEPSTTSCVYRNDLSNTVGETAGITQDVGSDPTVGEDVSMSQTLQEPMPVCTMCGQEIVCEECGEAEAEGLFLEVNDPDSVPHMEEGEHRASDPESDEEMADDSSAAPGGRTSATNGPHHH